ncbi:MAG: sterol desaturase family protein, partial [Variovorax sp.]
LIFGLGMVFPWGLLQLGWARLAPDPSGLQIALEILALAVWNDVHFWVNHRLLHGRWLRRFHGPHHRSVVTTPFATYSFHPIEALMLGNVILWPMLVHDFSFWALASVPVFSLFFNNVGHSNYDFFPKVSYDHWFAASRRHHLHHACHNGNYGFQFTFMDRLFGTRVAADAAEPQLRAFRDKESTWRAGMSACRACAIGATGKAWPTWRHCLRWPHGSGCMASMRCCMPRCCSLRSASA